MNDHLAATANGVVPGGLPGDRRAVAVIAAAVLRAAREAQGKSREEFAARAGVEPGLLASVEDAARPAWDLPYPQFSGLAQAAGAHDLVAGEMFWAAGSCDLLLTSVLNGDRPVPWDALTDTHSLDRARTLLRWALHGTPPAGGTLTVPAPVPLLSDGEQRLLRDRLWALVTSGVADAWAGTELLNLAAP